MNWLDCLLEATDEAETPRNYLYWSGLSAIAAVCGPNVYINRQGVYKLSPNLFVMLIGESGLGKGLPIYLARKLVKMVDNTRVISGRNTMASIIQRLGTSETVKGNGVPKFKDSRGFVVSGEFGNLLQEKGSLINLTEMYDTHFMGDWDNTTKGSGIDELRHINITLLGGSTQEHFMEAIPTSDVKGGFVGRILTVYEEERHKINPLSDTEVEDHLPYDSLAAHLRSISQIKGPFRFSREARVLWDHWYREIRSSKIHDPTGAINRLPDNVLKVAMCLNLAERADLILTFEHIQEAITKCLELSIGTKKLVGGKGKSALGEQTHMVMKSLWQAPGNMVLRSKLLRLHYGNIDSVDLDRITMNLETAGLVKTIIKPDNDIIIEMLEVGVNFISQHVEKV